MDASYVNCGSIYSSPLIFVWIQTIKMLIIYRIQLKHVLLISKNLIKSACASCSVNARGSFLCCREAANRVKRGGGGRIILLSSSLVGALKPGYAAYAASKAAVETMTKILAKELKGTGITANCVAPGPIATDLFFAGKTEEQVKRVIEECPHNRLGETKDVAPVVGFLATDASEWVNGQVIRVNGGYV
jgi:3-oxoacyl-[acyl-carrier protein] reductase